MKHIIKNFHFKATTPQEGDDVNFIIRGKFSTADEDRHGEVVDQKGWNLEDFKKNPVILFAHDHYTPAIGKAIEIGIDADGDLAGAIQFAVKEDKSGLSETIYNLFKGAFMRAFSVGFMNDVYEYDQVNDKVILKENTLLEISAVNVPANAMALAASKGVNVEPLSDFIKRMEKEKNKKKGVEDDDEPGEEDLENIENEDDELEDLHEDDVKAEVEKISKTNIETIKSAIETLTGVLNAETESGVKGRGANNGTAIKKIPVLLLNRAIKELVKIKKLKA